MVVQRELCLDLREEEKQIRGLNLPIKPRDHLAEATAHLPGLVCYRVLQGSQGPHNGGGWRSKRRTRS